MRHRCRGRSLPCLPGHRCGPGLCSRPSLGASQLHTVQVEPLRIHATLSDDNAGAGTTTGQQLPRRTVSVPGEEQAAEAASEAPIRALPGKSSLAGSSMEASKPRWMLRADEKGWSSLQRPALCMTARCMPDVSCNLHHFCGGRSVSTGLCVEMQLCAADLALHVKVECSCCWRQELKLATMRMHILLLTHSKPRIVLS